MKKILITGANSYIGLSFETYIEERYSDDYIIDTIDMMDKDWEKKSFAEYDVVFHVAGIAHQKETRKNRHLYYEVNCDLAVKTAAKAKQEGVSQFVFLSTMSVYGKNTGVITKETKPNPTSSYGKSKLQAEEEFRKLQTETFQVVILRPPMVYGKGCRGNFQAIVKIVDTLPIFPKVNNRRSMIYIENLCAFVVMCVQEELKGIFYPQNQAYMNTSAMAAGIAQTKKKKIIFSKLLGFFALMAAKVVPSAAKAFGNLIYEDTEDFDYCYCVEDLEETIRQSVR